ncbi:hypothetical protein R9X37_21410 [Serratia marcescens]|uniref:hypothetical protein n=1 Tax=Serratia marcescens TaxID=615 RepID=UPI00298D6D8D|nr:hypothetical protein [Serratia marcescens]MDW7737916.1 hypothetical protein [Serratia marcescens]
MSMSLEKIISSLSIENVNLRNSNIKIGDDINSLNFESFEKKSQYYKGIARMDTIAVVNKDDEKEESYVYLFHYAVGVRILKKEFEIKDEKDIDDGLLQLIEAEFGAEYSSNVLISEKELELFAKNNVGYHVWPYWREFVQSICARMNVPIKDVPFYNFGESDLPDETER